MADFAEQRKNMVESQVRPSDITDRRIIRAMLDLPRERFCPPDLRPVAYRDEMLQINDGKGPQARFAAAPRTIAKMIQALDLGDNDTILEIGAGSGYATAILSRIAAKVVAVESDRELAASSRAALAASGATNVVIVEGDLRAGHAAAAPYDAILINGAVAEVPRAILDQLKDGGRLATVISERSFGRLTQWRRIGGTFDSRVILDAAAPMLAAFARPPAFVF